jgi:very-short-patch-repair endonuclease
LSYPDGQLAVEYQGSEHANPRRLRRDVARHMDLRRAGWEVLYHTAEQVFPRPDRVVDDVRQILAARAPRLLAGVRGASRSGPPRVASSRAG